MFNIAMVVHGEEALLAVGFIFTIHFFNGHLRPEKFPMDSVIFTGRVTVKEMEEERPDEFARLTAAGRIDDLASEAAPRWVYRFGRTAGDDRRRARPAHGRLDSVRGPQLRSGHGRTP